MIIEVFGSKVAGKIRQPRIPVQANANFGSNMSIWLGVAK